MIDYRERTIRYSGSDLMNMVIHIAQIIKDLKPGEITQMMLRYHPIELHEQGAYLTYAGDGMIGLFQRWRKDGRYAVVSWLRLTESGSAWQLTDDWIDNIKLLFEAQPILLREMVVVDEISNDGGAL